MPDATADQGAEERERLARQIAPDVPMVVDKVTGRFKLAGKIDTATDEVTEGPWDKQLREEADRQYPTGEKG